ncbi:MBL fold metallo-hydrolase [Bacillus marasmi]|uniref:MBL fold metallo-hydrolase n=1 Tax=Bacillus marasmi TaxID=1926279 RepID=UPI0011C77D6D|nr:MBL fold metallo-hydrolase [Bacillus marasmi]
MRKNYSNLNGKNNQKTYKDLRRWQKERKSKVKDLSIQIEQFPNKMIEALQNNRSKITYTWIGHSTFLLQIEGLNILTDPVWAKRMGMQKRLTQPGIPLSDMPEIDIVVISHGHYDHLDFSTLKKLSGDPHYFVPVGMKALFNRKGYDKVTELCWWDKVIHGNLTLHFVPAQHWTRRTLTDMNSSHWGGWMIQSQEKTFYFVGDTGYFEGFKLIGEKFSIDTVLMPIGAYEPEWFMAESHINPEDSIRAFLELGATEFVPMHYGAYRLADDTGPEALERLCREWTRLNLPKEQLRVMLIGETEIK